MSKLIVLSLLLSSVVFANETVWKKPYWAWGAGINTDSAANQAFANAKPAVAALRTECDTSKGVVNTSYYYGYCAQDLDPMFCKWGCYTCPIYGTATCVVETSGELKPGALVEVLEDTDMFTGTHAVGHVTKGDKFHIDRIQGDWAALDKLDDGTSIPGWIKLKQIKVTTRD